MNNRIILITGPKHSGKTHCALALGKLLNVKTVDLDELIEIQSGKSPRALFYKGSEIFRKAEAEALASLIKSGPCIKETTLIIAAGGGLIDNTEALALLSKYREKNICIACLDIKAETAWQRINAGEMPAFLNTENPQDTHLALHERRSKAYKTLADLIIDAENKSPETIAAEIASYFLA